MLVRTNASALAIQEALLDAGVPAVLNGAAARLFLTIENNPDLQSVSRDGLSEQFEIASTPTPNQRLDTLFSNYEKALKLYKRV